jgi:hypothetical protein
MSAPLQGPTHDDDFCFHPSHTVSVVVLLRGSPPPSPSSLDLSLFSPMYSNPPRHGAHIVAAILNDPKLFKEWDEELAGMAGYEHTHTHMHHMCQNCCGGRSQSHITCYLVVCTCVCMCSSVCLCVLSVRSLCQQQPLFVHSCKTHHFCCMWFVSGFLNVWNVWYVCVCMFACFFVFTYACYVMDTHSRIKSMRTALLTELKKKKTPGDWTHVTSQIGMFSYTGLTPAQVKKMIETHHIYMLSNGLLTRGGGHKQTPPPPPPLSLSLSLFLSLSLLFICSFALYLSPPFA